VTPEQPSAARDVPPGPSGRAAKRDFPASSWPPLPKRVRVVEVGPRDGLQNIDHFVGTAVKAKMIRRLAGLGFDRIEAVSFVHPRAVPQMADAEAVLEAVGDIPARLTGLVPNVHGVERSLGLGLAELNFVLSASESQNQANLNQSISASVEQLEASVQRAAAAGIPLRLTISTAFGCPFEGYVPPERVLDLVRTGIRLGVSEVCLGDTTGMANPRQVHGMFTRLRDEVPEIPLAVHLHNTRGTGSANLIAALAAGVVMFDASMGGLGGCPFAPGATGNISTEDSVHMLHTLGVSTGIDLDGLVRAARELEPDLGVRLSGQVIRAGITFDGIGPDAPK